MHDVKGNELQTYFMETLIHLLKGNLGAGIFAMGDGFKNSGFIVGCIGIILIGAICIYNNHLLVNLSRQVKTLKELPKYPTFPETIAYSFEMGKPCFSNLKICVMNTMKTFIVITQLGFCVIYISIVAESVKTTIDMHTDFRMTKRLYILASIPLVMVVSLIHTLKFLAPVSAIAMVGMIYGWAGGIVVSSIDLPEFSSRKLIAPPLQWPLFIGTVIFSFEGIALVIPLRNEMREPDKFDTPLGVMNIGMSIVLTMVISFGFMTYWKYGDLVQGSATFNFPADLFSESIRIVVGLTILLSFPLQFYVVVKLFLREIKRWHGPFKHKIMAELILRVILVLVVYIFALAVPYVHLIVSLIGAVCSNALALFFPATADISLRTRPVEGETPEDRQSRLSRESHCGRLFMDGISIVLSILGSIFGTYIVIVDLIKEIRKDMQEE